MNPDPVVFAKHVLWKLSDVQAQVYHNQLLLIEVLARQKDMTATAVQSQWKAQIEQLRLDRYNESLAAVGIERDSDPPSPPTERRF